MWSSNIFDKGAKNIQLGKDSLFVKWCWEYNHMQKNETGPLYTSKINLKRIINLNTKAKIMNILQGNTTKIFS